jgi:thioredoxin-related protein
MKILHLNNENSSELNEYIKKGTPIFLLIYMEGCGPCNSTKPEWAKIENVLKNTDKDIVIADVEQANLHNLDSLHYKVAGFPTMIFISNKGKRIQTIEENGFQGRTIDTFVKWINHHTKSYSKQHMQGVVTKITRDNTRDIQQTRHIIRHNTNTIKKQRTTNKSKRTKHNSKRTKHNRKRTTNKSKRTTNKSKRTILM